MASGGREERHSRALEPLPELVVEHRSLYEDALDAADDAWKAGRLDVSKMETLIDSLLAKQLARVYEMAGGKLE